MHIHIWLDRAEPPEGRAALVYDAPEGPAEQFAGWLGLLRALYALLEPAQEEPS